MKNAHRFLHRLIAVALGVLAGQGFAATAATPATAPVSTSLSTGPLLSRTDVWCELAPIAPTASPQAMLKDLHSAGVSGIVALPTQFTQGSPALGPTARQSGMRLLASLGSLQKAPQFVTLLTSLKPELRPEGIILPHPPSQAERTKDFAQGKQLPRFEKQLQDLSEQMPLLYPCSEPWPFQEQARMAGCVDDTLSSNILALLKAASPEAKPSLFARSVRQSPGALLAGAVLFRATTIAELRKLGASLAVSTSPAELNARTQEVWRLASVLEATLPGAPVFEQDRLQVVMSQNRGQNLDTQQLKYLRDLLATRQKNAALQDGAYAIMVANDEDEILAYARMKGESTALVVVNTAAHEREIAFPSSRMVARGIAPGTLLQERTQPAVAIRNAITPHEFRVTTETLNLFVPARTAALYTTEK